MRTFLALAMLSLSAAITAAEAVKIEVTTATAIGFFPPFSQDELDADDGGISEGTSHVFFALEDLEKCLAPVKIRVSLELTRNLLFIDGRRSHKFTFPNKPGKDVGIVLIAPGKKPLVVYASAGPSSLQWLALDAAARYFSAPACERKF